MNTARRRARNSFTYPFTEPEFLPAPSSSSSIPAHEPFLNEVSPRNLSVPFRPFSSTTRSPTCGVASTLVVVDIDGLGVAVVRRGRVVVDFEVCGRGSA